MHDGSSKGAFDGEALRRAFHASNEIAAQRAREKIGQLDQKPNTCRYCGRYWQRWAGSKLDGHAACLVTEDFKRDLVELLRSAPAITYPAVATATGVSSSVVRSWTFSIRRV